MVIKAIEMLDMSLEDFQSQETKDDFEGEKQKIIMTGSPEEFGYKTKAVFLQQHPELEETTKFTECDILVCDNLESNSSKMQKARKLGIPIKTYGDFDGNNPQVHQKENNQEFDFNSETLF